ncbi:hypothetical protein MBLNU230_g7297t1 [Neophaeotheca triangularis]
MLTNRECERLLPLGAVSKPDADISGIGVLLAFLISAYGTFAAVLGAYVLGMVEPEQLAPVDERVMRIRSRVAQYPSLHRALRQTILVVSDQQIVTGIAIMTAGFVGLRSGDMTVYHYQIVIYLAWLSSSVHLSALTLLRPHLRDHPGTRAWRLLGMVVLFIMLVVGLVPTVSYDWGIINIADPTDLTVDLGERTGWGLPASCFWGRTYQDGVNNDAPIGYLLLFVSYVWKVGDMFTSTQSVYSAWLRVPLRRFAHRVLSAPARRYLQTSQRKYLWWYRLSLAPIIPMIAFLEFLASFSASLWLSALGLVFGTIQIVVPRYQNLEATGSQEDKWGFGQLVPLVLLVQPLGAVSEHLWPRLWSQSEKHETEKVKPSKPASGITSGPRRVSHQSRANSITPSVPQRHDVRLIEMLGQSPDASTTRTGDHDHFVDILLSSRTFGALVVLVHITLLGGGSIIMYFDAESVGIMRGQNWQYALVAVAFYVASSWTVVLFAGPFSRIGRAMIRT